MFRRLVLDDNAALVAIIAFVTTVTIAAFMTWRAVRMRRDQAERFANLPFNSDSAPDRHDHTA